MALPLPSLLVLLLVAVGARRGAAAGKSPYMVAFEARAAVLLNATAAGPGHDAYSELARLGLGAPGVTGAGMAPQFADMYARLDCSDFPVSAMTRILIEHGNSSGLPAPLKAEAGAAAAWLLASCLLVWADCLRVCFRRLSRRWRAGSTGWTRSSRGSSRAA